MPRRRWIVAARVALVLLTLFHIPAKEHRHSGVLAFLPQEKPRGNSIATRGPFAVGMFPPLPPSFEYGDEVVFVQRATNTRIVGKDKLERSIEEWEDDFRSEVDGGEFRSARLQTTVATTVSTTTLLVRWNATYVDPSVAWLVSLSESIPGWTPNFRPYTDQASKVRMFSYSALLRLFGDAFVTGKLRVPLACIQGTITCEFREEKENDEIKATTRNSIVSISEDLAYAQDITRGALSNRLCARDLQFFLEVARKPLEYRRDGERKEAKEDTVEKQQYEYWEDLVAEALPWRSVPGMKDPMYIEGQSKEDLAANLPLVFGTFSVVLVLAFANWIAPSLIGQSLFGPPSYIVPPSELNDIIPY